MIRKNEWIKLLQRVSEGISSWMLEKSRLIMYIKCSVLSEQTDISSYSYFMRKLLYLNIRW